MINSVGGLGYGYGYGTNLNAVALERQRKNEFKPTFCNADATYAKNQAQQRNTNIALGTLATAGAITAAIVFRKPIGNAVKAALPAIKNAFAKLGPAVKKLGLKAVELGKNLGSGVVAGAKKAANWVTGLFK